MQLEIKKKKKKKLEEENNGEEESKIDIVAQNKKTEQKEVKKRFLDRQQKADEVLGTKRKDLFNFIETKKELKNLKMVDVKENLVMINIAKVKYIILIEMDKYLI